MVLVKEQTHYAISLDEFTDQVWADLERGQEGGAGHYARWTGTKDECITKCLDVLKKTIENLIYESDDYGHELE